MENFLRGKYVKSYEKASDDHSMNEYLRNRSRLDWWERLEILRTLEVFNLEQIGNAPLLSLRLIKISNYFEVLKLGTAITWVEELI